MNIQSIKSYNCVSKNFRSSSKAVPNPMTFKGNTLSENGWSNISGINDLDCFDRKWAIPRAILLGLLHNGDLEVYCENNKPLLVFTQMPDKKVHCLFGNGTYCPYLWVAFMNDGPESLKEYKNDSKNRTHIYENGQLIEGVIMAPDDRCSVCNRTNLWHYDWQSGRNLVIPLRYLNLVSQRIDEIENY